MSIIFSPRNGKISMVIAPVVSGTAWAIGDPFVMVFVSPLVAVTLSLAMVAVILPWLLGKGRRAYLHGTGKQACWGYLGHTIRGEVDETGQIRVSVNDCQHASGLDLLKRLDRVAAPEKRQDDVKGWLLTQAGMVRLLDSLGGDPFPIHKLRRFLEREVWQTRRDD